MRFRILPKVKSFSDAAGNLHCPGDIVDLPPSYLGENWLEPVDHVEVKTPEVKIESVVKEAPIPLETPKKQRKVKKKLKS